MSLLRVLSAEILKMRSTLALRVALLAPAVVVVLYVLLPLTNRALPLPHSSNVAWSGFIRAVNGLWAFLMLPLFITLESALLAGVEHANQQWKHLFALPVPRYLHYLSKWIALTGLLALASAVLLILTVCGGWILGWLKPDSLLQGWPDLGKFSGQLLASIAASGLMLSIHTWVSLRWHSFTVAVGTGMVATVAGFLISQSHQWGHWYPWGLPMRVFLPDSPLFGFAIVYGGVGGLVLAALGLVDWVRREPD